MTIFVVGATGFIGSSLVESLYDNKHKVYVLSRHGIDTSRISQYCCQIIESDFISDFFNNLDGIHFDAVVNLLWNSASGLNKGCIKAQKENVSLNDYLIHNFANMQIDKILCAGSVAEYSYNRQPNKDDDKLIGTNLYGKYKTIVHQQYIDFVSKKHLPLIWMRFSCVIDKRTTNNNIFTYLVNNCLNDSESYFGPCTNYYNFISLQDIISAIILLCNRHFDNVCYEFNITSHLTKKLSYFVKYVAKKMHTINIIHIGARPNDNTIFERKDFSNSLTIKAIGEFEKCDFYSIINQILDKKNV